MCPTPPGVTVESAVLDDLDPLVEMWVTLARGQRAYDSHLEPEGNRTAVRTALAHHVVGDGVLVARDDSREANGGEKSLAGFVMFGVEQGDYEQTVVRGVVHNLFVAPSHRGQGIGSELLGRAEEALTDIGAEVFSLEAMARNEGARRFYERHGYHLHRVELEKSAQSDTHSKEDG